MDISDIASLRNEICDLKNSISDLKKFMDRRVSEVSAEVSASVTIFESQENVTQNKLKEFSEVLSRVTESKEASHSQNSGLDLSFIVNITKSSADKIMEAAEDIDKLFKDLALTDEQKKIANKLILQIYTSCEFQDLVCQRVNRVTENLNNFSEVLEEAFTNASPGNAETDNLKVKNTPVRDFHVTSPETEFKQVDIDKLFK